MVKQKKGAIINIGSGAARLSTGDPFYTYYCATKR